VSAGPGHFAVLSAIVFSIGLFGVVAHRGMLRAVISIAVLFTAPVIALVGFAQTGLGGAAAPRGNAFAVLALAAAVAQVTAAVAAAVLVWRRTGDADVDAEPEGEVS